MSAAQAAARAVLDRAENAAPDCSPDDVLALAQVGTGRAVLALAEEVEVVAELLRALVEHQTGAVVYRTGDGT